MKNQKKILIALASLFSVLFITLIIGIVFFNNYFFKETPKYLSFSTDYQPIKFGLSSVKTVQGFTIEKAAMVIPAEIEDIPNKLFFQFDTGAPSTIIYESSLNSLKKIGLNFKTLDMDGKSFIDELSIKLGGSQIYFKMIEIVEYSGETFTKNDTLVYKSLGSIGSDFISEYITEIDFKNYAIQFYREREDWMTKNHEFETFHFEGRKLMLPCVIDNKKQIMYYDSGCSSYGLMTTKKRYKNYSNANSDEVNYELLSWGRASWWNGTIQVYESPTDKTMSMGGSKIALNKVSHVDILDNFQGIIKPFTKIDGWLGNMPFLKYSLIFDAPKHEFLIIEK